MGWFIVQHSCICVLQHFQDPAFFLHVKIVPCRNSCLYSQNVFFYSSKILPLPRLVTLTTHAIHIENNPVVLPPYCEYHCSYNDLFLHSYTLVVTCGCKHVPAWCEPTLLNQSLSVTCLQRASTTQHYDQFHCASVLYVGSTLCHLQKFSGSSQQSVGIS